MKRIVLMLDVDGILNNDATKHRINRYTSDDCDPKAPDRIVGMDPELVKNLQKLVELTAAEVILSSTWRKDPMGLGKTEQLMRRAGWTGGQIFAGATAELYPGLHSHGRGEEILD